MSYFENWINRDPSYCDSVIKCLEMIDEQNYKENKTYNFFKIHLDWYQKFEIKSMKMGNLLYCLTQK